MWDFSECVIVIVIVISGAQLQVPQVQLVERAIPVANKTVERIRCSPFLLDEAEHSKYCEESHKAASNSRRLMFNGPEGLIKKYAEKSQSVYVVPSQSCAGGAMFGETLTWYVHHLRSEEKIALRDTQSFVLSTRLEGKCVQVQS